MSCPTYNSDCIQLVSFLQNTCSRTELGKVRSVGFVKQSYYPTLLADLALVGLGVKTPAEAWNPIATCPSYGTIIQYTTGDKPVGSPTTQPGQGGIETITTGITDVINFTLDEIIDNEAAIQSLNYQYDLIPFFATETRVWLYSTVGSAFISLLVPAEITARINGTGTITVADKNIPTSYPLPADGTGPFYNGVNIAELIAAAI